MATCSCICLQMVYSKKLGISRAGGFEKLQKGGQKLQKGGYVLCLENDACISKAEGRQYERKRNAVGVWEGGKGRGTPSPYLPAENGRGACCCLLCIHMYTMSEPKTLGKSRAGGHKILLFFGLILLFFGLILLFFGHNTTFFRSFDSNTTFFRLNTTLHQSSI